MANLTRSHTPIPRKKYIKGQEHKKAKKFLARYAPSIGFYLSMTNTGCATGKETNPQEAPKFAQNHSNLKDSNGVNASILHCYDWISTDFRREPVASYKRN